MDQSTVISELRAEFGRDYDQCAAMPPFAGAALALVNIDGTLRDSSIATGSSEISIVDYGAVADYPTTDNSAAIAATIAAAPTGSTIRIPAGTYKVLSAITVSKELHFVGPGTLKSAGNYSIFILTSFGNGSFDGVQFASTYAGTNISSAIYGSASTLSGTCIRNCVFGRVGITIRDGSDNAVADNSNVSITGNLFNGDYTGTVGAADTSNIIDLRGLANSVIADNRFDTAQHERFIKTSLSCRDLTITGNVFRSVSAIGRQAIDTFSDGRRIIVSNNTFDLSGGIWSECVEGKDAEPNADASEPAEIVVSGNIFAVTSTSANYTAISFFGSWGLPSATLTTSSISITNNLIKTTASSSLATNILATGFTSAVISGNTIDIADALNFQKAIDGSNNQACVISGNSIRNGFIQVNGTSSNSGGTTYANSPVLISITGNTIKGFQKLGGIYIVNCAGLTAVAITGNNINTTLGAASTALVYINASTISKLTLSGNNGITDTLYTSLGGATITTKVECGNGWQTFGGTSTKVPCWGTDGVSLGDTNITFASTTATVTGALTVTGLTTTGTLSAGGTTSSGPFIAVNNVVAAGLRGYSVQTSGLDRWKWGADGTAEGGANAGSLFSLASYDDAGAFLNGVLTIPRVSTGAFALTRVFSDTNSTEATTGGAGSIITSGGIFATKKIIAGTSISPSASAVTWTAGAGSPEGAVAAPIGSIYSRTDGGAVTSFYVKETGASGNNGWVAK